LSEIRATENPYSLGLLPNAIVIVSPTEIRAGKSMW